MIIGNPLSYRGYTMTWQGKRLQSLSGNNTTASYTYDEQGMRSSKTVNGVTTTFSYNGSLLMAQVQGSGTSQVKQLFSYDANGDVISVNYNGTEYFYLRNGQNDVVGLMDANGNRVVEYTYDAWGKLISTTGTLASTLGANNPFRYRGNYYDTETGLYYLMTRYYDPEVCRFISADVYMSTGQGVLGGNMWAYCGNNPVVRLDPSGCEWWHWALRAAIVVACAVAVVATAGGALGAVVAVSCVANGIAAATTASTIAAGAFIGSSLALGACAVSAASTSSSVSDFMDQGNWGTVISTAGGGALGASHGYSLSRTIPKDDPVPQKAKDTYEYVTSHNGSPKPGYKGGRTYANDGRSGSQILPTNTTYREYDVNPYIKGVNRGSERLVIGANSTGWYTKNHYRTFIQIK